FGRGAWSLLSLIMSLIAVLVSLLLILGAIFRRIYRNEDEDKEAYADSDADDEDEKRKKVSKVLKVATIILGILTPIVWLILDDLTLPMVWINKWTLYVGIVFLVHIVFLIVYKARRHKEDSDDDEGETTYDNAIGA
ncbi:MAG: hypothetical protein LBN34_08255, partial [Clostridiales Family XIII bacterium]|nr:hypothetical protein [Clostridiales Family XIII bacterium]